MGGKRRNARVRRTRCLGQELLLVPGIVKKKVIGSADLEVCLAKLKSVEQRLNQCSAQLRMIRLTSSVERTAEMLRMAFL